MIVHLNRSSQQPLVDQIVRQIRTQILSGVLQSNTPLPSIRSLAHELEISTITVTRAFDALSREELILAIPRKGFFVNRLPRMKRMGIALDRLYAQLEPAVAEAVDQGLSPTRIRPNIDANARCEKISQVRCSLKLDRHHPERTLSHLEFLRPIQLARFGIDTENDHTTGGLPGAIKKTSPGSTLNERGLDGTEK